MCTAKKLPWLQVAMLPPSQAMPSAPRFFISIRCEVARQKAAEGRRRWDEEARQRKAEAEQQKRAAARLASRRELLEAIAFWHESRRIGDYLESVEASLSHLDAESANAVRDRLRLAHELVGALDTVERLRRWRSPDEHLHALGVR